MQVSTATKSIDLDLGLFRQLVKLLPKDGGETIDILDQLGIVGKDDVQMASVGMGGEIRRRRAENEKGIVHDPFGTLAIRVPNRNLALEEARDI